MSVEHGIKSRIRKFDIIIFSQNKVWLTTLRELKNAPLLKLSNNAIVPGYNFFFGNSNTISTNLGA